WRRGDVGRAGHHRLCRQEEGADDNDERDCRDQVEKPFQDGQHAAPPWPAARCSTGKTADSEDRRGLPIRQAAAVDECWTAYILSMTECSPSIGALSLEAATMIAGTIASAVSTTSGSTRWPVWMNPSARI